jgi:IclR family transcriptional regulator, KDG regulon repressor
MVAAKPSARIERDLDLLRGLATEDGRDGGLGVVELAARLGRDKSQVSRALRALAAVGLVEREPDGRFRLGPELYALAARTASARLHRVAAHTLRALAAELEETVHLCALSGLEVLTLRSVAPPTHAFRASGWEGRTVPAHSTSAGRVLLADLAAEEVRRMFADADFGPPRPHQRVRTVEDLVDTIREARQQGFALVREEFEAGVVGASAPIRDFRGEIVAAINVSADAARLGGRLEAAARLCSHAAARISELLGAPGRAAALPRSPA